MSFKDGRIGVGKDPIFPLDISGSARIDGDLILGGRFSDSAGNPIQLGGGSGTQTIPAQNKNATPSWSSSSLTTRFDDGVIIASTEMNLNTYSRPAIATRNSSSSIKDYEISAIPNYYTSFTSNYAWDHGFLRIRAGGGTNSNTTSYIDLTGYNQNADMTRNIVFGTSGTERMRINSSGNVGIGTTSPSDFLTVRHGASSGSTYRGIALEENDGTIRWRTALSGANGSNDCYQYMVNASGTTTVQIHADGNSYFNGGNVGIGTTSPYSKLEITAGADKSHIRISEGNHNGSSSTFLYPALTYYARQDNTRRNTDPYTEGVGANGGASASIGFADRPGTYTYATYTRGSDIVFHTAKTVNDGLNLLGYYPRERMRITAEGRVGIGTTTPYANLQVSLGVGITGNVWTTGTTVADCHIVVGGNEWGGSGENESVKIGLGYFDRASANIPTYIGSRMLTSGTDTIAALVFGTRNSSSDTTATEERMCILPDGKVGIGTMTPSIELDVHGSGRIGRYLSGSCHDENKRNSYYFGRWDDTSAPSSGGYPGGSFVGMELKVGHYTDMGYGNCGNQASVRFWNWGCNYATSRVVMRITGDGYVRGINAFQNNSDDRLKHNEKNINVGLNVINKLQAKEYFKTSSMFDKNGNMYGSNHNFNLNTDGLPIDNSGILIKGVTREMGFIAQDVLKIDELKHAVHEGNLLKDASGNTYRPKYGLTYQDIFVMNVAATQELDRKVIALEKENAELKTKLLSVAILEGELAAIKQHLGI